MFIKKLELTNFKCHNSSQYHFGKINHFFGDNYTGKSSIGEAIVFCLFGMTKHGFKGYVKDYLQEGKTSMKVEVSLLFNNNEYIITRTMNTKGTTTAFINHEPAKESNIKKLLGDYQPFIYCFFPDIFPEEEKAATRTFIIKYLLNEKDTFDEFEKEKKRISKQIKQADSSRTYYEGQRSVLLKQIEAIPVQTKEAIPTPEHVVARKKQLQEELEYNKSRLEKQLREGYQLQANVSSCRDKLKEIQLAEQSINEYCPTCQQKLPDNRIQAIRMDHFERKNKLLKEIDLLEKKLEAERRHYSDLSHSKTVLETELRALDEQFPDTPTNESTGKLINQSESVELELKELAEKKTALSDELRQIKHRVGQLANSHQNHINKYLTDTRIDLFKQLKNGELRPDFLITYKNRPYRVSSYSEKIRCMLELIILINKELKMTFPLFLDNLESITHLKLPDTQIFTATVKKGMPLTLKVKE